MKTGKLAPCATKQSTRCYLTEFLKEHRVVQELKTIVAKQEATAVQQQTEIKALRAA